MNVENKKTKQFNFERIALLMKEDIDNCYKYLNDNDIPFDSNGKRRNITNMIYIQN